MDETGGAVRESGAMVSALFAILAFCMPAVGDDATAQALKDLKAAYKAKDTPAAVRVFDQLVSSFEGLAPKDQDEVVKVIESAFNSRRDDGKEVDDLFIAAAASLSGMGPAGGKALLRGLELKHLRARPSVLAALVQGLGEQNDPAMVPELLKWLKPEKPLGVQAIVVAGSVRALARYREADPKLRKQIVGEIVAVYADLDAKTRGERAKEHANPEVDTAFQQIETPLLLTLRTLSGEGFERADDWTKWWSKAKDADWSGNAPAPAAPPKKSGSPQAFEDVP
jgi:hypothetical protein